MKCFLSISILLIGAQFGLAQKGIKYSHILITNDDGVEDADRLLALAKSVKKVSKRVSIVVSSFDRSGTSNHTTFGKYQSSLEITCEYQDTINNISLYETPGNPSDCVLLGLNGLFPEDKPDLVLSGINSGANIGPGWFRSGTVGAIRTAAFLGVRGVALSGFDDDDERSYKAIPKWVTQLISSDLITQVDKNSYLTVGFPEIPLEEIKGIKIVERKISLNNPESVVFNMIHGNDPHNEENKTIWTMEYRGDTKVSPNKYDEDYLKEGYIVITPMTVNENNTFLINSFLEKVNAIPQFSLNE